jgi:hypothetical protein
MNQIQRHFYTNFDRGNIFFTFLRSALKFSTGEHFVSDIVSRKNVFVVFRVECSANVLETYNSIWIEEKPLRELGETWIDVFDFSFWRT